MSPRALPAILALLLGCARPVPAPASPEPTVEIAPTPAPVVTKPETVTVRDPQADRELATLRMSLLERTAQLADAERRLEDATTEVVRAMARLRTLATRAEAASAVAEAEVTLQQLRGRAGPDQAPEVRQAEASLRSASAAFDAENFGGAVYLATQAKRIATLGRGRLAEGGTSTRTGERAFAVPIALVTTARSNLRAGAGTNTSVVATVDAGTALTAYAYVQDWIRVTMADGRTAWVHSGLVKGASSSP